MRQASLVDELKVTPGPAATPTAPPNWQDAPLLRPVPRRAGATIGAFQRRSRAARTSAEQPAPSEPTAPAHPTEEDRS